MLIIAGVKETKKLEGYAVGFCIYCREIREVRVDALQLKKHFYYISYRNESDPWYESKCAVCGGVENIELSSYTRLLKKPSDRIDETIKKTYPNIYQDYRERLSVEKDLKRAPFELSKEARLAFIKQPFKALAPQIQSIYSAATHLDKHLLLSLIIGLSAFLGALIYTAGLTSGSGSNLVVGVAICSFIGIAFSWVFASRRRIKKQLLPLLVRSLKPLKPKAEELEQVERFYGITRAKIGKKWLFKALRKALEEEGVVKGPPRTAFNNVNVIKGDYVKAMRKKP